MFRIREGDAEAFSGMVRATYRALYDFAYGITRSPQAAEDVVQDVFAGIWQHRHAWNPQQSVRAYLYGAVRNRALNVLRDEARTRDRTEAASEAHLETTPHSELELADLLRDYRQALSEMPERRQEVFRLSRLYGLTYEEINHVLGISINTVRTQMSAALEYLRQRLSSHL